MEAFAGGATLTEERTDTVGSTEPERRSYVNWRRAIDNSGVSISTMRSRLEGEVLMVSPGAGQRFAQHAILFLQWYESGLSSGIFAAERGMKGPATSRLIAHMAQISLNPNSYRGPIQPPQPDNSTTIESRMNALVLENVEASTELQVIEAESIEQEVIEPVVTVIDQRPDATLIEGDGRDVRGFRLESSYGVGSTPEGVKRVSDSQRQKGVDYQKSQLVRRLATQRGMTVEQYLASQDQGQDGFQFPSLPESGFTHPSGKSKERSSSRGRITNGAFRPSVPDDWFADFERLRLSQGLVWGEEEDNELAWQTDALCAQTDPEAFFPEKGGSTRDAKRICTSCEVKSQCLDYALSHDERFGIWGGLSERERRRLRRARA